MNQRQKKQKPNFNHHPSWIQNFKKSSTSSNNPLFRFYSSQGSLAQPVTLYIPGDEDTSIPIKMYYDIENNQQKYCRELDSSQIKNFSNLVITDTDNKQFIRVSEDEVVRQSEWVKKYEPKRFVDLLTDQLHNRNLLTWLKSWDSVVFKQKKKNKIQAPIIFKKGINGSRSNYMLQQYNYKKLILLAGPPGCGKTTLARVIARHCGYHYVEVNASDDRSSKSLITKISNLLTNNSMLNQNKPICLIIDQVDGALESDSNGLKEVLNYIEKGENKQIKKKDKKNQNHKQKKQHQFNMKKPKFFHQKTQNNEQNQQRRNAFDRPIIFICNDPYVRGLKQLRQKAIVVYFTTLQQERVVKRLKQITQQQNIYIEHQLLVKLCKLCNSDIRSCVGVLELMVKLRKQQNITPKDFLNRMKMSLKKDTISSTNEFLSKMSNSRQIEKDLFSTYLYFTRNHDNPSLLFQTFFHNIVNFKYVFLRMQLAAQLYRQIISVDVRNKKNHGQVDDFTVLPFIFLRLNSKPQTVKIQFPSLIFQRNAKLRGNIAIVEKLYKQIPIAYKIFIKPHILVCDYLYLFWLSMLTSSSKQQDALRCVYKMITYGIKLNSKGSIHIFNPEFDVLLTFGAKKLQANLSLASRTLMEQNYEYLKMKNSILGQLSIDNNRQSIQTVINQLRKNRRRNRGQFNNQIKYKYLQGTGTEVKYDLKIGFFFDKKL